MRRLCLPPLVLALLFASIGTAAADDLGSRQEYIVNGEPVGPDDVYGTVALFWASDAEGPDDLHPSTILDYFRCSGVLIASEMVLTAAHCVDACDDSTECETDIITADEMFVGAGLRTLDDVWRAEVVQVHAVHVPEAYRSLPISTPPAYDIALLVLDTPIALQQPVALLRANDVDDLTSGLAQGYGGQRRPGSAPLLPQQQYRSLLNQLETPIDFSIRSELLTGQGPNSGSVCFGDSGGPLYVVDEGDVFVAGVASRFWGVEPDDEPCDAGAVYSLTPAYADWIAEKGSEPSAPQLRGGTGCSATSVPASRTASLLAGVLLTLLTLLCLRGRLSSLVAVGLVVLGVHGIGCGTAGDQSFCTEARDPRGTYCDPDTKRIDLQTAESIARERMPSNALLWFARAGGDAIVDPDGNAEAWLFEYYIPGQTEPPDGLFRLVTVRAPGTVDDHGNALATLLCIPTEPMVPFSSRNIIHNAIERLERAGVSVRLGEGGELAIRQDHPCSRLYSVWNFVAYGSSTVFYDDAGGFLGLGGDADAMDR